MSWQIDPPPELDVSFDASSAIRSERLGPRLSRVAMNVPDGSRVVDVGTDHARLLIGLIRSGRCPSGIGVELRDRPRRRATAAIRAAALQNSIEVRAGDGLAPVERGEADVAVLAGFGGRTAIGVFTAALERGLGIQRFVIQANRDLVALRDVLAANDFRLEHEELVFDDGRVFAILVAVPGVERLEPAQRWLGPRLLERRGPLFECHLESRRAHLARLASSRRLESRALIELEIVSANLHVA